MSEQPVEAVPAGLSSQGHQQVLEGLVSDLRSRYSRGTHRGRLDQIEQVATGLGHLISQLDDEEMREADYEDRLLASYRSGTFGTDPHTANHDARERLNDALARGKAG